LQLSTSTFPFSGIYLGKDSDLSETFASALPEAADLWRLCSCDGDNGDAEKSFAYQALWTGEHNPVAITIDMLGCIILDVRLHPGNEWSRIARASDRTWHEAANNIPHRLRGYSYDSANHQAGWRGFSHQAGRVRAIAQRDRPGMARYAVVLEERQRLQESP
jgi:hypothetical protein